jgi:hypothetical protein
MRILDISPLRGSAARALTDHLVDEEPVHAAYSAASGAVLFTDRRILLVTREHLLEEKVETTSWPWRALRHFAIQEGAGGRGSVRIWLGDEPQPLQLRAEGEVLHPLQQLLARMLPPFG